MQPVIRGQQDLNKAIGLIVGAAGLQDEFSLERADMLALRLAGELHEASKGFRPPEIALAMMAVLLEAADVIAARCDPDTRNLLHALSHDGWRTIVRNGTERIIHDQAHPLCIFATINGVLSSLANPAEKYKQKAEEALNDYSLSEEIIHEKLSKAKTLGHLVSTVVDLMAFASHAVWDYASHKGGNASSVVDAGLTYIADWIGAVDESDDEDGE